MHQIKRLDDRLKGPKGKGNLEKWDTNIPLLRTVFGKLLMAFFPFQFHDSVLLTFPHHNPSHSISQAQAFIKFISSGVYEYDQYLLSYKWSLMEWRVFLGSSVSQQEKSIFVQKKKKGIHTNTDQTAIFTLPKKTQRTKIRKVRPGPSSQATQTTRGISYLTGAL